MEYLAQSWEVLLVVLLLVLGYGFGRLAEYRHYRSIRKREDDLGDLIIVCCKTLPEDAGAFEAEAELPAFAKAFAASPILTGATTTLTFTIDNAANIMAIGSLDFTDTYPAGLVNATPANASTTCTGGTLTAVDGAGSITYTGGTVAAGGSCTVTVTVTSAAAGTYANVSGDLTSDGWGARELKDATAVDGVFDVGEFRESTRYARKRHELDFRVDGRVGVGGNIPSDLGEDTTFYAVCVPVARVLDRVVMPDGSPLDPASATRVHAHCVTKMAREAPTDGWWVATCS